MPEPGPHTVYYIQPDGSRRLATEEELNADHATILARLNGPGTVIPFPGSTHPSNDPDDEEPDLAMA